MTALKHYLQIDQRGSTVARELRGAAATFLTMAYILFVNPQILAAAGVPQQSAAPAPRRRRGCAASS